MSLLTLTSEAYLTRRIAALISLALGRGGDLERLLADTGISIDSYQHNHYQVTLPIYYRVLSNIANDFLETDLALEWGRQFNVASRGLPGLLMLSQDNVAAALQQGLHMLTRLGVPYLPAAGVTERGLEIRMDFPPLPQKMYTQLRLHSECVFASLLHTLRTLTQQSIQPLAVYFSTPAPAGVDYPTLFFHCPVEYASSELTLLLPASVASMPIPTADRQIAKELRELIEDNMARSQLQNGLSNRVAAIIARAPARPPSIDEIAAQMGMSGRTLRRRLEDDGANFHDIINDVRFRCAADMLLNTACSVESIAMQVGFSDASNFRRAFKRWGGQTPAEYRREKNSAELLSLASERMLEPRRDSAGNVVHQEVL